MGPTLTTIAVALGVLSVAALVYSLRLLIRTGTPVRRTSAGAAVTVDPEHFALRVIAVMVPEVKKLVSPSPDEVVVSLTAATPPGQAHEATIIARRGEEEERVTIDLDEHKGLRPAVEFLLGSGARAMPGGNAPRPA